MYNLFIPFQESQAYSKHQLWMSMQISPEFHRFQKYLFFIHFNNSAKGTAKGKAA